MIVQLAIWNVVSNYLPLYILINGLFINLSRYSSSELPIYKFIYLPSYNNIYIYVLYYTGLIYVYCIYLSN